MGIENKRKGIANRFILVDIQQTIEFFTKVHIYRTFLAPKEGIRVLEVYSGSDGVVIIGGVVMALREMTVLRQLM